MTGLGHTLESEDFVLWKKERKRKGKGKGSMERRKNWFTYRSRYELSHPRREEDEILFETTPSSNQ